MKENTLTGEMLEVDLSIMKCKNIHLNEKFTQKFIGGFGIGAKIIYDQVGPEVDSFSEKNMIVFAPGPLSGTAACANGRTHVVTKSPITGLMGMGNFGGFFGARLKKAGFEGIIIKSKSSKPVFLLIDDGDVRLIDADYLWGLDTHETIDVLRKKYGNDFSVAAIGQAGENLVKYACIVSDYSHASGRSSVGCIMGDKKIKAIAVRGTKNIPIFNRDRFQEAVIESFDRINDYPDKGDRRKIGAHFSRLQINTEKGIIRSGNFASHQLPKDHDFFQLPSSFAKHITYRPNSYGYNCMLAFSFGCELDTDISSGPYKGIRLEGAGWPFPAEEWGTKHGIKSYPAMLMCNELCNRYGMDSITPIVFAIELLEKGIINKEDVDGLDLRVGNEEAIIEMVRKIAYREGFGNILAEGVDIAAKIIGKGAEKYANTIKGQLILEPNRYLRGAARNLGTITCTRGGDDLTSTHAINVEESRPSWAEKLGWSKKKYISWLVKYIDMFPEEKEKIYGSPPRVEFLDRNSIEGKARLVVWFEHITTICNVLGICTASALMFPCIGPTIMAKYYSACTGRNITPEQLMEIGERIFNLTKLYNVRAGLRREDDDYPERFYQEPLTGGPYKGKTMLCKEKIEKMLDEYYEIRGWDIKTSIPLKGKIDELELENEAKLLPI